jgi:hypothetical protein
MTTGRNRLAHVFAALSSFLALILIGLVFVPYSSLKPLADRLVADGELETFTPHLSQVLRIPSGVAGGVLLLAAGWAILRPSAFSRLLSLFRRGSAIWLQDLRAFAADLRLLSLSRVELACIAAICSLGLVARLLLINRPIEYDEAYTVMAFAHSPFRILIADYHVPNNHIFHTILVRIAVLLLGSQPWQVRMPVLLAGMLLILFVFWLGRTLYAGDVGYLSAAIVAFLPDMVQRSVSARGYVIVALLSVAAFLLAHYLVRHRNHFAWSLLVLLCALGFYTVPIMLFPFGFLLVWMLMYTPYLDRMQYSALAWVVHLIAAGVMVVLLTLLLYSPVLISTGLKYIFPSSGVLHSQSLQSLLKGQPELASMALGEWTYRLPPVWRGAFVVGVFLSLLGTYAHTKHEVHTLFAFFPAVFVLLLIQRPNFLSRVWLWVVPFAAIWISAGLGVLLEAIRKFRVGRPFGLVLLVSILVGLGATGLQSSRQTVADNDFDFPAAEDVARWLAPRLTPRSLVMVDYAWDAYIQYYLYLQGVDKPLIFHPNKDKPFDEVFALKVYGPPDCPDGDVFKTREGFGPDVALLDLTRIREVAHIDIMTICWAPSMNR